MLRLNYIIYVIDDDFLSLSKNVYLFILRKNNCLKKIQKIMYYEDIKDRKW